MGSTRSVPATLGLPPLMEHALSLSTLLRLQADVEGMVPVFGYSTKAQTWLGLRFVPSLAQAAQAARSLTNALSLGAVCLILSTVPTSVSMHGG